MKTRKWKKTLLTFVLIGALLGVQVMEMIAYAADTETGEPTVIVSNANELLTAIETKPKDTVIGISGVIVLDEDFLTVGDTKRKYTIVRMNDAACFEITGNQVTIQNLTIDGANIISDSSMFTVDAMDKYVNFLNVTIKNCHTNKNGGAIFVENGTATINMCRFQNNHGIVGGHISVWNSSVADIINCHFETGVADVYGGAIEFCSSGRCTIGSCTIYNNSAPGGGGIYNDGYVSVNNSKIYGNHATIGGADIANTDDAVFQMMEGIDELVELFKSDDILPKAWVNDYNAESGGYIPGVTPSSLKSMMKLDYEEIVEEPVEPSEPTDPDDTGNDTTDPTTPGEGDSTDEPSTDTEDTGTDEEPSTPTEPSVPDEGEDDDQEKPTEPSQPDDSDQDVTEEPSEPTAPGDPDDGQEEPATPPGDDSDEGDTQTPSNNNTSNTTTDNSDHSTHDDHSTSTTDNSKTDNSKTDNSTVTEDNSSVVNNYYYTTENPGQQNQQQTQIQTPAPQVIVVKDSSSDKDETSSTQTLDPSNNIRIEAEGADVIFEVVDGVYSISIKAEKYSEPVQEVQTVTTSASVEADDGQSLNWYEIIKIALLAALVVNVMRKPKTT